MIFMIFPVTCFCIEFSFVWLPFRRHFDTFSASFFIFGGAFFHVFPDGVFIDFTGFPDRNWTQKVSAIGSDADRPPPQMRAAASTSFPRKLCRRFGMFFIVIHDFTFLSSCIFACFDTSKNNSFS